MATQSSDWIIFTNTYKLIYKNKSVIIVCIICSSSDKQLTTLKEQLTLRQTRDCHYIDQWSNCHLTWINDVETTGECYPLDHLGRRIFAQTDLCIRLKTISL